MKKFIIKFSLIIVSIIIIFVASLYILASANVFGEIPEKEELSILKLNLATELWSSDGKLISKVYKQNRSESRFSDYPKSLVEALIATEDSRFYQHNGIDYRSLARVVIKSIILRDKSAGGGSTLTQQLAKNYFGRSNFGILTMPITKVKEHILAYRIEKVMTKNEIIEYYLNTVPFGEGVFGIQSASQRFYSKNVNFLKTEEAAVLIGMLKANTAYNPRLHPDKSKQRRNVVISQMEKANYLSKAEADKLKAKKLSIRYNGHERYDNYGYFSKRVIDKAEEILSEYQKEDGSEYKLKSDGLKIYTTLNSKMQDLAVKSMLNHLSNQQKEFNKQWIKNRSSSKIKSIIESELQKSTSYKFLKSKLSKEDLKRELNNKSSRLIFDSKDFYSANISIRDSIEHYVKMIQGAIVAFDNDNGAVLVYVGGKNSKLLPYDLVMAKRQMASTFKPFVYTSALIGGWKPCNYIDNSKVTYTDYDNWSPKNSDNLYDGHYSMKGALTKSANVASVKLYIEAGKENINDLVNKLKISDQKLADFPSVALGVESSSLYRLTSAYDIFSNEGKHKEPYIIERIEDRDGNEIYNRKLQDEEEIISKLNSELMRDMLQSVVEKGTAQSLINKYNVKGEYGGKTGTAQNYSDAWTIVFNENITIGAWSGFFNPNISFNSYLGYGSRAALPIVGSFINNLEKNQSFNYFTNRKFPELSNEAKELLDCPDFREDNFFERNFDFMEKKEQKAEKKKSFWKRIFG